ncbi:MAG: histidinol phosphatase [Propionibacteriaceae bacterium]|jgi:histidinol-phosphatase|nr:histidinol phosphatase [Propionibacteriaceae bacterium]
MAASRELIDDLRLAHLLADHADAITMERFRSADLKTSQKSDASVVSDADTAAEEAIRSMLSSARPRDSVHGEEMADSGWGPRRWIIDPIDGTANYVRGVPVWATLIALMNGETVEAGVVSAPALSRRWWACTDGGAFTGRTLLQGQPMNVSSVTDVSDAFLSYSSLHGWVDSGRGRQFGELLRTSARTRAFGDFWSYMMVAEGVVDIACEPSLALHDMAALDIIVREAGGLFTSIDGVDGPVGPGAVATNGFLHDDVLDILAPIEDNLEDSLIIRREALTIDE